MNEEDKIRWSQQLFNSMAESGVWAVPRSGLILTRRGDQFVLTDTMPHDKEMSMTEEELHKYQAEDFYLIQQEFANAGIVITADPKFDWLKKGKE